MALFFSSYINDSTNNYAISIQHMQELQNRISLSNYHFVNMLLHQTDTWNATLKRLRLAKPTRQQQMVLLFVIMQDARPLHTEGDTQKAPSFRWPHRYKKKKNKAEREKVVLRLCGTHNRQQWPHKLLPQLLQGGPVDSKQVPPVIFSYPIIFLWHS